MGRKKGYKHTEESINKMSENGKGKHNHKGELNPNYGKGLLGDKNGMYGKKHSIETRLKISEKAGQRCGENNPFFGKKHSKETKKKISESYIERYTPEKHYNWKGGISFEPYCQIWEDEEYKQSIRDRDKNQCQNCGISRLLSYKVYETNLHIHHINYNKKDCHPDNLITLCNSCNAKANKDRENHTILYQSIVKGV